MQKPIYSSEEEQALMAQLWSKKIADDPEMFVLFAFPWGQEGTPLAKFTGPRKWQREILRDMRDAIKENREADAANAAMEVLRYATASGRGIGKSALVSWLIIWMLTTRIGSSVIISANSESQLRSITWGELTKWSTMAINSHWFEISATKLVPADWLATLVERDMKKVTRYWGAEGMLGSEENPDAYAGVHNMDGMMVIFDEASGIPDSIWSVAAGFFTENIVDRYWFAFSNPRRNSGYFFECFHKKRDFWKGKQVDSRAVEGTDKNFYQKVIDEYGEDSREARVEVYGEFPSEGDDQFISPTIVSEAMGRAQYKDPGAPVVIGIDPARGGMDSTVIAVRKGRDIISIKRYQGDDTMSTVGNIIDAIEEFKPDLVCMDEGGLGYGILDRLKEQRYKIKGVNFGWKAKSPIMYANKRAEMWGMMREWIRTASLPDDRRLKDDLTGVRRKYDSKGAMLLESKKEMKARGLASPDAADAIAVTFAFPVANKEYNEQNKRRNEGHYSNVPTSWMGC